MSALTFKVFLEWLEMAFQCLAMANLRFKSRKCYLGYNQVVYLGHIVSKDQVKLDPEKIWAVERFPVLTTSRAFGGFLEPTLYYHRFIANFSKVAHPLSELISPKLPFMWMDQC